MLLSMTLASSRVVALIQARLGSSRLPGKSRLPMPLAAAGPAHTILGHVVSRARRASLISEVLVATTSQPLDNELAVLASQLDVGVFRAMSTTYWAVLQVR